MPNPFGPPGCPYDPGDAGIGRNIRVDTPTLHRTIGSWPGDYSVGKHRSHDEGTFQWLVGPEPGQWVQFFPCDRFASHAYGSNEAGPGIEISGQNGEPLTDWQIDALGQILRFLVDEWGVSPTFTEGDPRVQYDTAGPSGFVTHNNVFSDIPKYTHHDYITADEFTRAIGGATPASPLKDTTMRLFHDLATDLWWFATANEMTVCPPNHVWNLAVAGVPTGDLPTDTVVWLGQELPGPVQAVESELIQGEPFALNVVLSGTATPV